MKILPHSLYSPDIAPSDYHLFQLMEHSPDKQHFHSYKDAEKWVDLLLASKDLVFLT